MSIFRRRAEESPPPEGAGQDSAGGERPATPWRPTHEFRPEAAEHEHAEPWGAGTSFEPQPYYRPGMPTLHDDAAPVAVAQPHAHQDGRADSEASEPARRDDEPGLTGPVPVPDAVDDPAVDPAASVGVEAPEPQVAPVSRSGRNMPVATVVGIGLLALVVVAAWWDPLAFAAFACVAALAAVVEWRSVLAKHARRVPLIPAVLASIGFITATYFDATEGLMVALMAGLAGIVAWRVVDERIENTLADSLASMLTLLWIPFLASFLVLLENADDGWHRVLVVVLAVVGADTGGLFAGMLFGKHPMAPRVSPKKTWEGFAGGLVLGTAAAGTAAYFFYDGRWWIGAIVGVACVLAAVMGDLAESAVKRDIQVKDMSSFLPGHGGIMDRIDSLLLAAPVAYVVFALLLGSR